MKLPLSDRDKFTKLLIKKGAKEIGIETNVDYYFRHPIRNFKQTDEALRIREKRLNNKVLYEITYKGSKLNPDSKTREELNVEIKDLNNMVSILKVLGFGLSAKIVKTRQNWKLDSYIISIDQLEDLGEYVEFEKMIKRDEIKDISKYVAEMHVFIKELGLDPKNQIRRSYLELFLERKEN